MYVHSFIFSSLLVPPASELLNLVLCLCFQLKRMMESDAAMTEDIAYNIIPLDTTSTTNAIVSFNEVDNLSSIILKSSSHICSDVIQQNARYVQQYQL